MTAAAAATTGRLRGWLSVRHSLGLEAALVVTLYGVYELARGLVVVNTREADRHADQLVALERSLHLFVEGRVQHAVHALPGLAGLLGVSYLTLHLAVTAVVLLWLQLRRRDWPESASPTPSRAATSTSTTGSSARSTTRTRPFRACTSATR